MEGAPMKYLFVAFGLFEILAGVGMLTATVESLAEQTGDPNFSASAVLPVHAFGAAILSLGIIAVLGFFVREKMAVIALCVGFALYNSLAAFLLLTAGPGSMDTLTPGLIHSAFGVIFVGGLIYTARQSPAA